MREFLKAGGATPILTLGFLMVAGSPSAATPGRIPLYGFRAQTPPPPKTIMETAALSRRRVSVSVSPSTAIVQGGLTQTFLATVSGATDKSVTWRVDETGGGTIDARGLYRAPATAGIYHVRATSAADPTKSAVAKVTINQADPRPTISVFTGTPATISAGQSATLSWSVSGATSLSLDNGIGAVTGSSVSVSPTATTTYTLTATNATGSSTAQTAITLGGTSTATIFHEHFAWSGNHGDVLPTNRGGGSTVWWNNDAWDARQDTEFNAVGNGGNHIDIHKAANANPSDATEDNRTLILGGDGSPGVGTMHMNFQTIISARLRNPMVISAHQPGVVTFYAQRFVSDGHWWEVGIQPVSVGVHGAEFGPIPTPLADGTPGPRDGDNAAGPGHRPAADGLNFVIGGFDDCPTQGQWYFFHSIKKSIGGQISDAYNPVASLNLLGVSKPSEEDTLYQWRLIFKPDGVDLYADLEQDGLLKFKQHFATAIPWSEVYVSLMGVSYQSNHHPADIGCGLEAFGATPELAKIRELHWKDISVGPMKYARTSVAPRDLGVGNIYQQTGWQSQDLRDTQRFGPPVNGIPRPNPGGYDDPYSGLSFLYTSYDSGFGFAGAPDPVSSFNLAVTVAADQAQAAAAQFLYDIRYSVGGTGTATLFLNDQAVGVLPSDEPGAASGTIGPSWIHRSIGVPMNLLKPGVNKVRVALQGEVQMDRLQLEFFHLN